MSKKTDFVARLMSQVKPRYPIPGEPNANATLLEQGVVLILMRHLTWKQAEQSLESLKSAYGDWNEVRVSQVQEIGSHLRTGSRKSGMQLLRDLVPASTALKSYLQDVFQQTHGLDLEFLREDIPAGGKTIAQLSELGLTGGSYLLWVAGGGVVPVHTGLVRMLDRLDLIQRTASVKKARAAIDPLVPEGKSLDFTVTFHEIADRWTDPNDPIYMSVDSLRECPFGKKAYHDRLAQVKRDKERSKRDEVRRIAAEKREAERLKREDERAKKRAEAEAKRLEREAERREKAAQRKRDAHKKKVVAARRKAEIERKRVQDKKKAAKTAAAAKKKAAKKKATKKRVVTKKPSAKKPAKKKTVKKSAPKKAAKKKVAKSAPKKKAAARKKAVGKRPGTKKKPAASKPAKKPVSKKKAAKKAGVQKAGAQKAGAKKAGAKKAGAKKAGAKKAGAKKRAGGASSAQYVAARLVLASASPRRRTLLGEAGLRFEVDPADVDESLAPGLTPEEAAEELARRKASAVAGRRAGEDLIVLGADTIVAVGKQGAADVEILGKPVDEPEAQRMLSRLSGSRHRVVTGVAVVRTRDGHARSGHERTWVTMRPLAPHEVDAYVATGEWRDKAGGYAIQETADAFVTRLEEGGFDNVVGLPVGLARQLLAEVGEAGDASGDDAPH